MQHSTDALAGGINSVNLATSNTNLNARFQNIADDIASLNAKLDALREAFKKNGTLE